MTYISSEWLHLRRILASHCGLAMTDGSGFKAWLTFAPPPKYWLVALTPYLGSVCERWYCYQVEQSISRRVRQMIAKIVFREIFEQYNVNISAVIDI